MRNGKIQVILMTTAILPIMYVAYKSNKFMSSKSSENSTMEEEVIGVDDMENEESTQRTISGSTNEANQQCLSEKLPSFVNLSIVWNGNLPEIAFQKLSPPSILVVSAGNDHPNNVSEEKVRTSQKLGAILVGSLKPNGERSAFSQEHEEVHIMAPSDYDLSSADQDGNHSRFGGTSGATPLVTGSLAAFEWLSDYHPTAEEAKLLLEKTAIPTQYSYDDPQTNGVGMINAYKLGMVGKKVKELCGTDKLCIREMIQGEELYTFPKDTEVIDAVERAFPECSMNHCSDHFSVCTDKSTVLKRLRKAAFLDTSNKELWKYLSCTYQSLGFPKDAQGAMSVYKALFGPFQNNRKAYSICTTDSECSLVPDNCSVAPTEFLAFSQKEAEVYYVDSCQEKPLCNNKCSCGNEERLAGKIYFSRCINSQCQVNTIEDLNYQESNQEIQVEGLSPRDSQPSGQR